MDLRFLPGFAALVVLFAGRLAMAQANVPDLTPKVSVPLLPTRALDLHPAPATPPSWSTPLKPQPKPALHVSRTRFVLLSALVYGGAIADMHQTLRERVYSSWHETDPLARPFVRLPAPAYYATGLAMATGINWLSWKMAHSQRWHRLSPLPQLLAATGNFYGYHSNLR